MDEGAVTESSRLIAETLRLKEAVAATHKVLEGCAHHSPPWWTAHENWCEAHDEYEGHARRNVDRLARMLQVAIKELDHYAGSMSGRSAENALAEIEKIAREE